MEGKTPLTFSTKNPKPNLNITFGSAKYTSTGSTGSGGYGWTITDGGV